MATVNHTIDAAGKKLGRIASDAASALMGKRSPEFARNIVAPVKVEVVNAKRLVISEKKRLTKTYLKHTGYPGSQRRDPMALIIDKKGIGEVVRKAVYKMLPPNRLRSKMMANLKVTE